MTHLDEKLMASQLELERLYNKNQTLKRIRQEFLDCKEFDFKAYIKSVGLDLDFCLDLLVQMALHKRANLQTLIGLLRHHADNCQEIADTLVQCIAAGLVDYTELGHTFIVRVTVDAETQADLDRYQYPLPLVVKPNRVKQNNQSGYYTTQSSVILKNNHHDDDVCLDHINRMNSIPLTLNEGVAKMVKNQWKGLDKPKEGENIDSFKSRCRAFEKYDTTSRVVIKQVMDITDRVYLTHRYDKRGRTYCMGYHVTYQGNPWNKAVVELADKELVE